jgi:hypothetical protein
LASETAGAWGTTSPRSGGRRKAAWWLLAVGVVGVAGAVAVVLRAPPTPATLAHAVEAQSPAAVAPSEAPRPPSPAAPTETAKEEPPVPAATDDKLEVAGPDTRLGVRQAPTSIPVPPPTSTPAAPHPAWHPAPRVASGPSGGNAPRPGASAPLPKPPPAKGDVYDDRK